MKINLNSWHYKVMNFCHNATQGETMWSDERPKSLCTYFWSFWGELFRFLFLYGLISAVVFGFLISGWSFFHNHSPSARVVFILYCLVGLCFILSVLYNFLKRNRRKKSQGKKKISRGLTLLDTFVGYLKAVKNKACPMIEYFNDK